MPSGSGLRPELETAGLLARAARRLHRASQVMEVFHHAVLQQNAWATDRTLYAVRPSEPAVRKAFWPIGQLHIGVTDALDHISFYQPLGDRGLRLEEPEPESENKVQAGDICVAVAVMGRWARQGMVTVWSMLRHRRDDGRRLRLFVLGDSVGLADWDEAVAEVLAATGRQGGLGGVATRLEESSTERIDISQSEFFLTYLRRLPRRCKAGKGFRQELFARMLVHELLPPEVQRCLVIDIGDVLFFDDVADLWDFGDSFNSTDVLAAGWHFSKIPKPSEMNGGVVLYNLKQMRAHNFTSDSLYAARIAVSTYGPEACEWDQDIINVLRQHVYPTKANQPRVVRLPCRWSLIPSMEWKLGWNSPGLSQPEVWEHKRYPGILSAEWVEVYCPSSVELLQMAYASLQPVVRQRLLASIEIEGTPLEPEYAAELTARFSGPGCECGEKVSLLHLPGTMKYWPWLRRLFTFHWPPGLALKQPDQEIAAQADDLSSPDMDGLFSTSMLMGQIEGWVANFKNCATMPTPADRQYRMVVWAKSAQRPGIRSSAVSLAFNPGNPLAGARLALGSTVGGEFRGLDLEISREGWFLRWNPWGPILASYEQVKPTGGSLAWVYLDSHRHLFAAGQLPAHRSLPLTSSADENEGEDPMISGMLPAGVSSFLASLGDSLEVWLSAGAGWGPGGLSEADGSPAVHWLICNCGTAGVAEEEEEITPRPPHPPHLGAPSWQLCPAPTEREN
ncbi:unnamed protein product [Polarella glacialis]|uniref:Uncharacterized protein n=1 Tax=Polarella glacialis TaxID=89957 RepID=A0A813JRG0_POLGL|nr:unnamed protein product [Polarella glacialis]